MRGILACNQQPFVKTKHQLTFEPLSEKNGLVHPIAWHNSTARFTLPSLLLTSAESLCRVDLDHFLQDGTGQANIWLEFENLKPTQLTADVALDDVSLRWNSDSAPIRVDYLQGRLNETLDGNQLTFGTQDLVIKPIGNDPVYFGDAKIEATWKDKNLYDGVLTIASLDLRALTTIGLQLPISEKALNLIRDLQATGTIENFESSWQGPINAPDRYEFSTNFNGLTVQDHVAHEDHNFNRFGFSNLSGSIVANEAGGTVTLDSPNSTLSFPGIFFEKDFSLDTLQMQASWTIKPKLEFKVDSLLVSNTDASAQVHGGWADTAEPALLKFAAICIT